ncbi:RNA polymerase sigma factor [Dyadobacter sp. CY312]|uniref:RNA polymerase sigma factor n=1 Tax=Dyadobacter sp. CY312 TaxID=2907303 RepID=UPI001F1C3FCE|nr:sigma-70 family RNA polymerase sigma factor [Dyadobacter sp. CY312]MCE7040131.1 sigma-70 family RNA polymerase sigma factor [Dyadobacter sp. CY312]
MKLKKLHNEQDLLLRVSEGDEKAFTEIFYAYHQELGAYILKLTKSNRHAEEIVQDVFVKIWLRRENLNEINDFNSYLFIMARNHTYNVLRNEARIHGLHTELDPEKLTNHHEDSASQPEMEQYYVLIEQAVALLPPQQQKAYLLSRKDGLKHEQIAENMQLSRETVKRHISLSLSSITKYVRTNAERMGVALIFFLIKS